MKLLLPSTLGYAVNFVWSLKSGYGSSCFKR